jgi:hypothetical protein
MNVSTKQIIEVVGVIAVVASLLFVGYQLQLETRVALSQQYATRSESMKADIRTRLESDTYMSDRDLQWASGWRPPYWNEQFETDFVKSGRTGSQMVAQVFNNYLNLYQIDNLYYQYQQGMLDEEFWAKSRVSLKNLLRNDLIRETFPRQAELLPILEVIEEIILEIEVE